MASVALRNIPDVIHRKIKRLQLDYEDLEIKKTLEEIYLEAIDIGLKELEVKVEKLKKEKPEK